MKQTQSRLAHVHGAYLLVVLSLLHVEAAISQRENKGFAFEASVEPRLGVLSGSAFNGWRAGLAVGYKITPTYSLWLMVGTGSGREDGTSRSTFPEKHDELSVLRFAARRTFSVDSSLKLAPIVGYRVSTFLLSDNSTVSGSGFEVGLGATIPLGPLFEAGAEAVYTYDSYRHRSGTVPPVSSFSGSDLALRFLIRFHPSIPVHD
jgi:hypothetical protein